MEPVNSAAASAPVQSVNNSQIRIFGMSMAEITVLSAALTSVPASLLPHVVHGGWADLLGPMPILTIIGQLGIAFGSVVVVRAVGGNGGITRSGAHPRPPSMNKE